MTLNFDLAQVTLTEFGVGQDNGHEQTFVTVPVDAGVQSALREMATVTWSEMQAIEDGPVNYQASEKHAATEYLQLPLDDELCETVRILHNAANLHLESDALADPGGIFCYFARFIDRQQRRLTALRRATYFKGVLKNKNRLVRMLDDTLKVIDDDVFKLDNDFDLLSDSTTIHILHPTGFEFTCKLQKAILQAVPDNVKALKKDLGFVEFSNIAEYAQKHPRAARYVASIRSQEETKSVDKRLLKQLCKRTGVEITESDGKVRVDDGHEMGFLEVLDRRRYEISLVKEEPERYRASARRRIDG